ncbi:uncharacterized protein [Dermacentor andersoni]|uniref:uncharacterized protein n=1 Tax=Dermacentor andersoni TaxID=34620 RepID=UPI00241796EE|nr:uncharacterized protein LOC126534899 [Dermacentor andersoni]
MLELSLRSTFPVDAVIAISSVGSMEDDNNCYAAPPNVLFTYVPRFPSLESHWHFVLANTTYANTRILVGLSLEMATLIYVLKQDAHNLGDSLYARCSGVALTSRDAICGQRSSLDPKTQYIDKPYIIYGTFIRNNSRNQVAFAEYYTSARDKVFQARRSYGRIRRRMALMLFNVHLGDVRKKCGAEVFDTLKWLCHDFRDPSNCG